MLSILKTKTNQVLVRSEILKWEYAYVLLTVKHTHLTIYTSTVQQDD